MTRPATTAARKIPVPVADSQLKLKTAASAAGFITTGGTRITSLSRAETGNRGKERLSRNDLVCGRPQMNTTALNIIQGNQAWKISDFELRIADCEMRISLSRPSAITSAKSV